MELCQIQLKTGQWFWAPRDGYKKVKEQLNDPVSNFVEFQSYDGEPTMFEKELFASMYITTPETRKVAARNEMKMKRENVQLQAEASDPVSQL